MNNFVNYFTLQCKRCKICNTVIGNKQKDYCDNCIKKQQALQKKKTGMNNEYNSRENIQNQRW